MERVRGFLLDIDGTLTEGDRPIPGAVEALAEIERRGLPYRLVTNTSRRPRVEIAAVLRAAGFDVGPERILMPAILARRRILDSGRPRGMLVVPESCRVDLDGVVPADDEVDWVVVGDVGDGFTWDVLDRAFRRLLDGAGLIALHKNRYWNDGEALRIDAGPFVAALEYAAGVEAEVVGKPSPAFFRLALDELGIGGPDDVWMVGDDVRTDGAGSKRFGCRFALVRTGKFRDGDLDVEPRPDRVLGSIAELFA